MVKKHLHISPQSKNNQQTLRCVTLGAGDAAKATVKIAARGEVGHGSSAIESGERAEEGEGRDGAVEEARVCLAEGVACEDARGLLQPQND